MIATYRLPDGLWCAATSQGVLAYGVDYPILLDKLRDADFPGMPEDYEVDPQTWRSTLTSAFAAEIDALKDLPYGEIEDKQEQLSQQLANVERSLEREALRTEIHRCELQMDREVEQLEANPEVVGFDHNQLVLIVRNGPTGARLRELVRRFNAL